MIIWCDRFVAFRLYDTNKMMTLKTVTKTIQRRDFAEIFPHF